MTRQSVRVLLAMSLLGVLAGCGSVSRGPAVRREMSVVFTPEQRQVIESADNTGYLIRRGDVLAVRDMFNDVLNQDQVLVLPDGNASFFGLGPVRVAGMTLTDINHLLTTEYAKDFRDPKLTVGVKELGGTDIYILGEVRQPGRYELPSEGFSLLAAVAMAGGFEKGADRGSIVLARVTANGYLCREIDLSNFENGVMFDPLVADLQPYDVIWVERTAIGDFAAFTSTLITSLLSYTQLAVDVKYVTEGNVIRR